MVMNKFQEVYRLIVDNGNYIQPILPGGYLGMDNWASDRYEMGEWFAGMADAGYSRWIGRRDSEGNVLWRVNDYYPAPLEYAGITVEEFESLDV